MKALLERPMSPRLAWIAAVALLSSGGIYCVVYNVAAGRPEGLGVGLSWAVVSLLPWLVAFEIGKRANYEPTGSWKANWWRIAAILLATALISVAMQNMLWEDKQFTLRAAVVALVRRIPPALLISLLLFLIPMLERNSEHDADSPSHARSDLPLLPRQIDWIRARGNYLEISAGARRILHRMTMRTAEQLLTGHDFVRVHRSALINAARVHKIDRGKLADEIVLHDGTRLKVGGAYRPQVERLFGNRSNSEGWT